MLRPNSKSASGTAIIVVPGPLGDQNGLCRARGCEATHYWGVGETLFLRASSALNPGRKDDETIPWIATAWRLESDPNAGAGVAAIITIRERIRFHNVKPNPNHSGDWGTLTAKDVAFSINDANFGSPKVGADLYKYSTDYSGDVATKYNADSTHSQAAFLDIFHEVRVIDDRTVVIPFRSFDSTWHSYFLGQSGRSVSIMSKKAHDYTDGTYQNVGDFLRASVVETGPYAIESWSRDDKVTIKSRYGDSQQHYLPELTPKTARVVLVQVSDPTARVAMLRSGDADVALIPPKDSRQFLVDGTSFGVTGTRNEIQLGVFFSGNLWETVSAKDGSALDPYASGGVYQIDWPWIGDPRNAQDMEEARLVRWAMAKSYDRDAVNKALLGCLGIPVHVEYVSIKHHRYLKDGTTQAYNRSSCSTDASRLKWEYLYDLAAARQAITGLAVQGDYFKGSASPSGPLGARAFETNLYAGPEFGGGASLTGEIADAVAGYWVDLGLKVSTLKYAYQTFRPSVVNRTNTIPWITSCAIGSEGNLWGSPKGLVQTSLTRGAFSCGFESPEILKFYRATAIEQNPARAEELVDQYIQYMWEQVLMPGIVAVSTNLVVFNAGKVASWPMPLSATGEIDGVWNLDLRP